MLVSAIQAAIAAAAWAILVNPAKVERRPPRYGVEAEGAKVIKLTILPSAETRIWS